MGVHVDGRGILDSGFHKHPGGKWVALRLEDKKALVAEVNEVAGRAHALVAAEYRGLKAGELDQLRRNAREGGTYLRVVKNTLARRALEGTAFECMGEALAGPLILGFSLEEPSAAARVLRDFGKKADALSIKAVAVGGRLYPAAEAERLATLPSREQALAMLAGVLQAPISKFVRTLAEPNAKLARTLAAIRDQKQAA